LETNVRRTDFRRIALRLAKARESSHMDHLDFRAAARLFATLGHPDEG
jgi:hypothetical protein